MKVQVEEHPFEPPEVVDYWVDPNTANMAIPSVPKFLKLAEQHGLVIRVQVTRVRTPDEFYKDPKRRTEIKKAGVEAENIFITATNLQDFAFTASWHAGGFTGAVIGGQRSGHRPEVLYPQITTALKEIARCLS